MARLTLLCGLPGSGKTTYALQMAQRGAIRLSSDEWMVPLFGQHMPRELFDQRLRTVRQLQWELAAQLLARGVDVVIDDGFWTRRDRDDYRVKGEATGAEVELVYFDIPLAELEKRLEKRNAALPSGTFQIDAAALHFFAQKFEPPQPDERFTRFGSDD